MALTPLDIQNKNFSTKMRGYNQDEVDDFLDMIVRDYEESIAKNKELEKSLKHAEEKLEYFNELKEALNQSIVVAQDTADKVKSSATKESEVIVTSAQSRADELISNATQKAHLLTSTAEDRAKEILTDATAQARQLAHETNDLKSKTRVFHQQLLLLLETQLDQARSGDWEEVLKPMSAYIGDGHEVLKEVLDNELDNEAVDTLDSNESIVEETSHEEAGLTIDIPELIKSDEE